MYVHTRFSTWLVCGLIIGTGGLWVPIVLVLKHVHKFRIRHRGEIPKLCDCCGSYHPEDELTPITDDSGVRVGVVCDRATEVSDETLEYALKTPMVVKYFH